MYTCVSSSLTSFLFSVCSAVVCSSVVGSTGSYSPVFISRSGREPVSDSVSTFASASLLGLVACAHLFYALNEAHFLC